MRVIVAGGRDFDNYDQLDAACDQVLGYVLKYEPAIQVHEDTVVLSGLARGADALGVRWAESWNLYVEKYPADWDRYGKSAGYRRNEEMAKNADALIAFWDGDSRGTKHMIDLALKHGLEVHVYRY